jgi:hypothetical protein
MASVLSESSSSATTVTLPSPLGYSAFPARPVPGRFREHSFPRGDDPGQAQIRFNRLVAEALHGEPSPELRNAELGRAATRALVNFGINQARGKHWKLDPSDSMDVDAAATHEADDGWESIQDYGKFLQETADTFRTESSSIYPATPQGMTPTSRERALRMERIMSIPSVDGMSWHKFRFNVDFAHLAPLTARENRIHAQQSTKLIDWISDPANDELFHGWGSLDQVVDPPPASEETQNYREGQEKEALGRIVGEHDGQSADWETFGRGELGWRPAEGRAETSFAKYLALEVPQSSSRLGPGVTSREPSRSNSLGGSDEDTRSVVSQDNHWRRTIFG